MTGQERVDWLSGIVGLFHIGLVTLDSSIVSRGIVANKGFKATMERLRLFHFLRPKEKCILW